jgi:hypothetical protein
MYAPSFIVGGPGGSASFVNDERFVAWLEQVFAFNREHGMHALEVVCDRLVEFRISYLLEHTTETKILAYVSEADQAAEMKKLGLL